ncbi:altronate dehydratase family protein [Alphaproteobacteria bacterium]|nr:altronate dehydratase family protein [Alphaproteobacteria bacterium]
MFNLIKLNAIDNVAVAPMNIPLGSIITSELTSETNIPFGHKISIKNINKGDLVYKYGQIIGIASEKINKGSHVHSHNLVFHEFTRSYKKNKVSKNINYKKNRFFYGYQRKSGGVGTRNYIGLISTVNCSATVVKKIADKVNEYLLTKKFYNIDGAVCLKHSSGCGMNISGKGMDVFNRTIEGFKTHQNFGKVFVIGLGCECAQISLYNKNNLNSEIEYLNIQDEGGTNKIIDNVYKKIIKDIPKINAIERTQQTLSELNLALQCGGSDSYSGITANPALGIATDMLIYHGGSAILSETPEIYGAEHLLIERVHDKKLINKINNQIQWWKKYTDINDASLDNNPSPGNKKGGLTTILEKSLGAVAKSGNTALVDVLDYGQKISKKGLQFMDSPGFDPISVTGQVASGANLICFTTGRGSCFGFKPTPSLKIATNTNMYNNLHEDMDINAGTIMDGVNSVEEIGEIIFEELINIASGKKTKSEINDYGDDEFNPWIIGATM